VQSTEYKTTILITSIQRHHLAKPQPRQVNANNLHSNKVESDPPAALKINEVTLCDVFDAPQAHREQLKSSAVPWTEKLVQCRSPPSSDKSKKVEDFSYSSHFS
jgi:hypothetical protein